MVNEEGLVNIAAHSNNHTVRNATARTINTTSQLEKLATLARHKDER
jgi:hypothetical protein